MTGRLSQQPAVASRLERLVERAMTFAIDECDDDLAVARLAWLAQDDHAAIDQAGEVCVDHFHAIRLANAVVDQVRRRVQQATLGHRGHKRDPLYRIRKLAAGLG